MGAVRTPSERQEGRVARRRRETRSRLMRAAQQVMARKGIDATTLQEITESADVAFGSFYNYFESKEAIVEAIIQETIESFGDALNRLAESVDDPAEVVSASVRYTVRKAAEDEAWGWFLIQSGMSTAVFQIGLVQRMARDIGVAIQAGRCKANDLEFTVLAAAGTALAIITACLRGEIVEDAPERAAAIVLRVLGLSSQEAQEVANRPLPDKSRLHLSAGPLASSDRPSRKGSRVDHRSGRRATWARSRS